MAFRELFFKCSPILICILCIYVALFREKCHQFNSDVHSYLGTKSPYRHVANVVAEELTYSGCKPIKVWSLLRHGTRTPKTKTIIEMKRRLGGIRDAIVHSSNAEKSHLCEEHKDSFKTWDLVMEDSSNQLLTAEGEIEMLALGKRFRKRFPDLVKDGYSNETFKFSYTNHQRTEISAFNFVSGLFGSQTLKDVWFPKALDRDPILRFYKLCMKWKKTIFKGNNTLKEREEFALSSHANKTKENVSKRLGLGFLLHFDDLALMYEMCAFETAWFADKISPWCTVFTKPDMLILEYYTDLKYYWRDGYGFNLNHEQACVAFNDLANHFLSESSETKGIFYFTHSGTLLKMLSFLNLYKDEMILRASNFEEQKNRLWKVSKIDPFGTNLQFILYKCADTKCILTLHQERPVRFPGCPEDTDLCPLHIFMSLFNSSLECNFNDMCSLDK